MRSLTAAKWGASKTTLLILYKALIRSLIDYGSPALDNANLQVLEIYNKIQYKALTICCGAMRGTALTELQNECGDPPLSYRDLKIP